MPRITCKTPSTGRPVNIVKANVSTAFTVIAEAPDFSLPDTGNTYVSRDPLDANRAIRPGEIFFMTPLFARNKSASECWIDVRLVQESSTATGTTLECPGRVVVPGGDTALIPIQGRSLLKRAAGNVYGDRIEVRAQTANALDIWASAEEKLSAEHFGVV